jgi:hypothetical protein
MHAAESPNQRVVPTIFVDLFAVCSRISTDRLVDLTTRTIVRARTFSDHPRNYQPTNFVGDERSAEIVRRYKAGETIKGISRELKVARCTVQVHLDRAGIVRRAATRNSRPLSFDEAKEMLEPGSTWRGVATAMGVDTNTV